MQIKHRISPIAKRRPKKTMPRHKQVGAACWVETKRKLGRRVKENGSVVFKKEVVGT